MREYFRSFIAVFAIILGVIPAFAVDFPDVSKNHWAYPQIKLLSEQSIVIGYPDGTFKPDDNVTRAEFASMAIKALGQEHTNVAQPVNFTDIDTEYWAYDAIQKALYFELVSCPPSGQPFRPDDSVSRAEALSVAVNALTTENISVEKAKEVLSKVYGDYKVIPEWFVIPAGKAEILGMVVVIPSAKKNMEADRPATRAEVTAMLFNMMEQAKLNPNQKLAEAMRKKTGDGFVIPDAFVKGSVGTIPAGSVVPVQVAAAMNSQTSQAGEIYVAKAPQNYITRDKYILVYKGSDLKGQILDVRAGKLFLRNGVLVLDNDLLVTQNDQTVQIHGVADIKNKHNKLVTFLRKIFKGDKVKVIPSDVVYLKLLEGLKVDLTNGWIIE